MRRIDKSLRIEINTQLESRIIRPPVANMRINRRRLRIGMTQQILHLAQGRLHFESLESPPYALESEPIKSVPPHV